MIELEGITKRFPGAQRPAVDDVTLAVPEGTTTALIGPSGCGKTTTMRMINRMVEPSSGRILVAGEDVTRGDPVQLRRRIGYVIQQVGLFPHMSVGKNIATVPELLGWAKGRIATRVDELLDLVGLDPNQFRDARPRQLSGGQRQRVGVARALAADPPVMLMDEPFGAIDPIARGRLQEEFKAILRRVRKTVLIVTHDLDEAVTMGDRLAIMRDGRLVQYAPPAEVLAHPADAFVEEFVGPDRALKRLGLATVDSVMVAGGGDAGDGARVGSGTSLREALALMVGSGASRLVVVDGEGRPLGHLGREVVLDAARLDA